MINVRKFICLGLLLFLNVHKVFPFTVGFDSNYFAVSGTYSTQTAVIINDSNNILPVQIEMFKRLQSPTGEEILEPCNDFVIIPKQLLVPPNDESVVTITWNGKEMPEMEMAYRLKFKELSLPKTEEDLNAEKTAKIATAKINFTTSYMKTVFVVPPPPFIGKSEVVVEAVSPSVNAQKKQMMVVDLYNNGTIHRVIEHGILTLKISGSETPVELSPKEFLYISFLAKSRARIVIPWPDNVSTRAKIKAEIRSGKR